jgi:3-methyladenine DNA glycosylase AlkD
VPSLSRDWTEAQLVGRIRAGLRACADPERAAPMRAYMKSVMPYLGVRLPQVREVCRPLLAEGPNLDRDTWEAVVRELYDGAAYREERYAALVVVRHRRYERFLRATAMPLLEHLVRVGAWWDLVDEVSHGVGHVLIADRTATTPTIRSWCRDPDLWIRRSAIICQVGHGDRTGRVLLSAAVEANLDGRDFFIRKAIGWALRDLARTDPDFVRSFVTTHGERLAPLSRREALKHLGT